MARGRRREIPPCSKTYGFPIYCAAWVPIERIAAAAAEKEEGEDNPASETKKEEEEEGKAQGTQPPSFPTVDRNRILVVLGGGGGEGRSGVPNALLVAEFDLASKCLSQDPVFRLGTDADVPYRMAVHPGGDGLVCSFPKSCRWFDWDLPEGKESNKLTLKSSTKILKPLEDVGLQLALVFNAEGSLLATGGEDGHLRVFKWPSMENILDQTDAHTTVKDLDFSWNGKFLVSLGNSGPCRVWDLALLTVIAGRSRVAIGTFRPLVDRSMLTGIANLPRETGEIFGFCRFSRTAGDRHVLYVTAMHGDQAKLVSWDCRSRNKLGTKKIARDPISAFNVSMDGKYLAVGTVEGDICIFSCSDMRAQITVKQAHLGIVTALVFSHDSRSLVSVSFDSNARVTVIEGKRASGYNTWLLVLMIIMAIVIYYMRLKEIL